MLAIALIGALSLLALSVVIYTMKTGISPMPSTAKAKRCILEALPMELQGTVVELGSGWGTLAFPLAKKFTSAQVIGYELSPLPYLYSRLQLKLLPQQNLRIVRQDFHQSSLSDATAVVCYLYHGAMTRLKDKFEGELSPGTWVISNTFAIPGWTPINVFNINDLYHTKIYLYRIAG